MYDAERERGSARAWVFCVCPRDAGTGRGRGEIHLERGQDFGKRTWRGRRNENLKWRGRKVEEVEKGKR